MYGSGAQARNIVYDYGLPCNYLLWGQMRIHEHPRSRVYTVGFWGL